MIKRVLFLTAALLAACTVNALAATDSETGQVSVTIPTVLDLVANGSINVSFGTLTGSDIGQGNAFLYTANSSGNLVVLSNYNTTTLTGQVTTNFAAGLSVTLKARAWNADGTANGYVNIMNSGTPTTAQPLASWGPLGATNVQLANCSYQMNDVSAADDAGSYTAVVTYTLTGV